MVTVKLVEKKVNRKVGMDIVASLITIYSTVETIWSTQSMSLAKSPSQDEDPCVSTTSFARVTAEWRAPVAAPGIARTVFESTEPRAAVLVVDKSMIAATSLALMHQSHCDINWRAKLARDGGDGCSARMLLLTYLEAHAGA